MDEREQIEEAISAINSQRSLLGDAVVDTTIAALRERLAAISDTSNTPHIAQQRKQVTVLFADVSGFTAMSENMDHEEVNTVINSLWTRVDGAILKHGGRIDKHIGDAVMALFGAPTAREDDPERAVRAALQVQNEVESWKQEFVDSGSHLQAQALGLRLRIGINTGPALIGTIGTTSEYTAIGDTVNLASRVETSAPPGSVLISHNTYRHVPGVFDVTVLEPITVKGKSEPVQVYRVNRIRPRGQRATKRGVTGIETRMVGREAELARLQAAFQDTDSHKKTRLINVVAEAGTGKSRLLYEFTNWLQQQPEPVRLIRGRASADMVKVPASLIRDVFSNVCEIQDSDRASVAREKLERALSRHKPVGPDANIAAHFIGQFIGFDFSDSPHLKGILADAQQIRDAAFHYIAEELAEWSQRQSVVLLLEDVQWSDSTSLDLIDYLLESQPDLRLMVLGSARVTLFEQRPDWSADSAQRTRLDLRPLSEEECRKLLGEILQKVRDIPPALVTLVLEKADGSPFYIEELINVLIEGGVITTGEQEWRVELDKLRALRVPATLTGLLQARLDTLAPGHREILQRASVVGRVFWPTVLEQMEDPNPQPVIMRPAVEPSLTALRAKELIFPNEESALVGSSEYLFKNAVLHDVTYESVLLRLRRVYHVQVAEGLIRLSGERAGESAGRVGEHFEQAGEWARAAEWYVQAGKRAQDTYAPEAAANYFTKAIDFFRHKPDPATTGLQLDAYNGLGEVLLWQARYTDAISTYKSMLELATNNGNAVAQSHALLGIASCFFQQGESRDAMDYAVRAEQMAQRIGAKAEIAMALWVQGSSYYRLSEGLEALSHAEHALAINSELNDRHEMARCLNLIGAAYYSMGRYEDAEKYWGNAFELFEGLADRRKGMDVLNNLGVIADARGDYAQAFLRYDRALEIAREMGYRDGEIVFLTNRGGVQAARGNFSAAEADMLQAIELSGKNGSWILPKTYYFLAEASVRTGKQEQALHAAQTSLDLSRADGAPEYLGAAYRALGMISKELCAPVSVSNAEGQPSMVMADDLFKESVRVLEEGNLDIERAITLREWARYEFKDGNRQRGAELWKEARDIFWQLGANMEYERMAELPA